MEEVVKMNNKEYWAKRAEQIILESERSVLDFETDMIAAYNIALIEIQKELDAFFGRYAKQNKIPYAEVRKRLTITELKSFQQELKEWYKLAQELGMNEEYTNYLKLLFNRLYLSRLESLEASIRFQIEKLSAGKHTGMTELATINYMSSYYSTYYTMAVGVSTGVNFATVDTLGVETAIKTRWDGANYSDRVWADKTKLVAALKKLLPQSFSRGLSSTQIGIMLSKELNTSKNRGIALARTEINYIANQASLASYNMANLKKYEYLATLDMRTSDICRDLDGFVGPVSQAKVGVNFPPMHVRCRSTTIPYFEDDDTDDRIARDEDGKNIKVPRKMSQEEWIKQYVPKDQQEKLLKFKNKYRK